MGAPVINYDLSLVKILPAHNNEIGRLSLSALTVAAALAARFISNELAISDE